MAVSRKAEDHLLEKSSVLSYSATQRSSFTDLHSVETAIGGHAGDAWPQKLRDKKLFGEPKLYSIIIDTCTG